MRVHKERYPYYLRHTLDHVQEAIALSSGKTRGELDQDRMYQLAIVRLIEIIGEASNRIAYEDRILYPDLPWAEMVGTRHKMAHGYDVIDYNIVWDIVQRHLPPLVPILERYCRENPISED